MAPPAGTGHHGECVRFLNIAHAALSAVIVVHDTEAVIRLADSRLRLRRHASGPRRGRTGARKPLVYSENER